MDYFITLQLINNHYIATYFSSKDLVLIRQLQFKHAGLERYTVSLLNNIQNFNCLSSPGLFLNGYKYFRYRSASNKCLQKIRCGTIRQLTLFSETRIKPFE